MLTKRCILAIAVTGALLSGCAATRPAPAPAPEDEEVHGGMHESVRMGDFTVRAERAYYADNLKYMTTLSRHGQFVVVSVSVTNETAVPIDGSLQPLFGLVDEHGAVFASSDELTQLVNLGSAGALEALNPHIPRQTNFVFEAPRGAGYQLIAAVETSYHRTVASIRLTIDE